MKLRKGLIITAAFALVAVSCTKQNQPKKNPWGSFLATAMKFCFGETIPYVALNEETAYYSFRAQDGAGYFVVGDDNETDLLTDTYGDLLIKAGYEFVDDADPYYAKETSDFAIITSFEYYEATEEYEAGNEVYVEFEYNVQVSTSVKMNLADAYFDFVDVNAPKLPAYEGAEISKGCYYNPSGVGELLEIDIYGSSADEMDAYADLLESKGWTLGEGEYTGDYLAYYGQTGAFLELQNWIGYSYDCIRILFYQSEPPLPPEEGFPILHVLQALGVPELSEDDFAPYPEQEDTEYEFDDYYGCDVYITGTTSEDCADYVDAMVDDYGWVLEDVDYTYDEEGEDPTLVIATEYLISLVTGGDYDVQMLVCDYLITNGYVDLYMGTTPHKEEHTGAFPLDDLNAYLEEYGLGFTLTSALPGETFTYSTFFNDYHCFQIKVDGDSVATFKTALNDILVGAGYSITSETAAQVVYDESVYYHEVVIGYSSDDNYTFVNFWE